MLRYVADAAPVKAADTAGFLQLARLSAVLHNRGVWQSDLNLGNFLLAADGLSAVTSELQSLRLADALAQGCARTVML